MDEVQLTERLIGFDTSTAHGLEQALDFIEGVMAGSGAQVVRRRLADRECVTATIGSGGPHLIFHGHVDVVPGHADQYTAQIRDGKLYGRGAYDMKGALAAMMLATADLAHDLEGATVELVVVPDEEASEPGPNCSQMLVDAGMRADLVICGEPTDMQVGVQAKGVLLLRATVGGVAAHGSTPWLGRSAILDGIDLYRRIPELPFATHSTELFSRPSVNLGRIAGGDAVNKVPDECLLDIDVRFLPGQDADDVLHQIRGLGPWQIDVLLQREPAFVDPAHPLVVALLDAVSVHEPSAASVGRDGASDAVAFLRVGVPAVEFGPTGAGHHGPEEHVQIESLVTYRRALVDFARRAGGSAVGTPERVEAV